MKQLSEQKQTPEEKLLYIAELAKLDPLLILIPHVIDMDAFGKLLKTFAGKTITFPTMEEIKRIIKQTRKVRDSLKQLVRKKGCKDYIGGLYDLALNFESREVRKATQVTITKIALHQYFNKIMNTDFKVPIDKLQDINTDEALKLYKLFLKDMSMRTNIIKAVENIQEYRNKL